MKGDIKEREMFSLYTHRGRQDPVIKSSNVVDLKMFHTYTHTKLKTKQTYIKSRAL
jgi:hypothetical protein